MVAEALILSLAFNLAMLAWVGLLSASRLKTRRAVVELLKGTWRTSCHLAHLRDLAASRLEDGGRLTRMDTRQVAGTLGFLLGGETSARIAHEAALRGCSYSEAAPVFSDDRGNIPNLDKNAVRHL